MYCTNCGKQVPEGARFCTGCGTPLGKSGPAAADPAPASSQSGKKGNFLRALLFGICAALFTTVIVPALFTQKQKLPDIEDDGVTNPAYSAAFSQHFLVPPASAFFGSKSAHYVKTSNDGLGTLDNMEFAYEDGIITALCETFYILVDGTDEGSRQALHNAFLANLAPYEAMSHCTVSYDLGSRVYTYTVLITNLDTPEVLRQCYSLGLLHNQEEGDVKAAGIKLTEEQLLASGYIKR